MKRTFLKATPKLLAVLAMILVGLYFILPRDPGAEDQRQKVLETAVIGQFLQYERANVSEKETRRKVLVRFCQALLQEQVGLDKKEHFHLTLGYILQQIDEPDLSGAFLEPLRSELSFTPLTAWALALLDKDPQGSVTMPPTPEGNAWVNLRLQLLAYETFQEEPPLATSLLLRQLEQEMNRSTRWQMILQTLAWLGLLFFVGYQFSQRMMAKKGLILLWHLNESPVPHPRVWFGLVGLLLLVSLLLEGGLGLWGPSENRVLWELLAYLIKMFLLLGVMYRPWIRTAQKKLRFWVYKPLSWLELLRIFQLFCVSIFFYHACLFLLVSLDWPFQGMEHSEMETFLADSSWGATLFATLTVCVLAPFFEEAFFRKGLLSAMSKWVPVQSGLLITAIVFACFHPLSHFPLIVGLGYLFGWVYLKTGNLSASILLHVAWNTTMFLQLL